MQNNFVKSIVVVGGGTAGWMTASSLAHAFAHLPISITVVESSEIGTVGVGEATIPTIREFYHSLGMQDADVMRATNATCKLGIQFQDWYKKGESFFHPFAHYGQAVNEVPFHHYWLKLKQAGYSAKIDEFSLGVMLAKHQKFTFPSENPPSTMSVFDWALHFDAGLFANYLREFAISKGVKVIDDRIERVVLREPDGFIDSLILERQGAISAQLFVDCSGFGGLLIEGALKTGYEDWSEWLLCDRALAVQTESVTAPPPYTVATAEAAGWRWNIPLQHRQGNGHVYSSHHMSDDEAKQLLLAGVTGRTITEPRTIKFVPGRRKKAWNKNCIAVGLSSGFLEPLESTSIALIELAIDKIKLFFPGEDFNADVIDEFNERTRLEYERVRDFVIFHYKATAREDSEFWRYCRAMTLPAELDYKLRLFKERGYVVKYPWEMFQLPSWLAIYTGYDYLPNNYDPRADRFADAYLRTVFDEMRRSVLAAVEVSPTHESVIQAL